MRLIDADALGIGLANTAVFVQKDYARGWNAVIKLIDEAPTIDPESLRARGEWIVKQTAIGKDYTICSVCKTDFKFKTDKGTLARLDMRGMPYCPRCGTEMEVSEDA